MTRDGYELELGHAFIRPDSVVGFEKGKDAGLLEAKEEPRRLAFAHDQIVRVESYEWDGMRRRDAGSPPPADTLDIGRDIICGLFKNSNCTPVPRKGPPRTP